MLTSATGREWAILCRLSRTAAGSGRLGMGHPLSPLAHSSRLRQKQQRPLAWPIGSQKIGEILIYADQARHTAGSIGKGPESTSA
jgi:hypothetical protein